MPLAKKPSVAKKVGNTARKNQTRGKSAVLGFISGKHGPLSMAAIETGVEKEGLNQSTVYRIVNALIEEGIVREVMISPEKRYIELADSGDHHHVVCVSCGKIEELAGCVTEGIEKKALKNTSQFKTVDRHSLEFFGICTACSR